MERCAELCLVSRQEQEQIREIIDEYIGSLRKVNRVIFLKRYWYMCSYEEIAELTGLNKKAVGSRLKRMRDNLKVILERKGYDYEG